MKNEFIDMIYNNTYDIIERQLGVDTVYKEAYRKYLSKKYLNLIGILDPEDKSEKYHSFVMAIVKDEKRYLTNLTKNQLLSILLVDNAYERIKYLSQFAFEQAKMCYKTKKYLNDDVGYRDRTNEIIRLLDEVKPYNLEEAKTHVSETILDMRLVYGKNANLMSLRMAAINR